MTPVPTPNDLNEPANVHLFPLFRPTRNNHSVSLIIITSVPSSSSALSQQECQRRDRDSRLMNPLLTPFDEACKQETPLPQHLFLSPSPPTATLLSPDVHNNKLRRNNLLFPQDMDGTKEAATDGRGNDRCLRRHDGQSGDGVRRDSWRGRCLKVDLIQAA